jgi:hypothetical protein
MDSYSQSDAIFDVLRQKYVRRAPEEVVRQSLLYAMIHRFGYPKSAIAIERKVPGLDRRFDIVVFSKEGAPLLLIECKVDKISQAAKEQIIGYNAFIKAPYICLASKEEIITGFYNEAKGDYDFATGFIRYDLL